MEDNQWFICEVCRGFIEHERPANYIVLVLGKDIIFTFHNVIKGRQRPIRILWVSVLCLALIRDRHCESRQGIFIFKHIGRWVRGAVVAQWIRPRTLNREVPGSNILAAAVVPLGKALYPHCLVLRKWLKAVGPLVAYYYYNNYYYYYC